MVELALYSVARVWTQLCIVLFVVFGSVLEQLQCRPFYTATLPGNMWCCCCIVLCVVFVKSLNVNPSGRYAAVLLGQHVLVLCCLCVVVGEVAHRPQRGSLFA